MRTVIRPTSINSAWEAFFRNCRQISIVIIEVALFKIDVKELINAASKAANIRPRNPVIREKQYLNNYTRP